MRLGKLEFSPGFLLAAAMLNYADTQGIVLPALCACLLHELGHYGAICLAGGKIRCVRVTVVGAEMHFKRGLSYPGELIASLAGPGVNLTLAGIFFRWSWGALFSGINLALALFNLLPIAGMDGGRALMCLLSMLMGPQRAGTVCRVVDGVFRFACLCFGILLVAVGGNFTMLLVGLWLNFGAKEKENRGGGVAIRKRKRYNKPYALL